VVRSGEDEEPGRRVRVSGLAAVDRSAVSGQHLVPPVVGQPFRVRAGVVECRHPPTLPPAGRGRSTRRASCGYRARSMSARFNHVGHCVTDLVRSRRFYEELLGFTFVREIRPSDESSAKLVRLHPPLGMTACYLERDGFVLELLHFAGEGAAARPWRERVMNEPGLTHISVSCDVPAVCARLAEYGGEMLADTDIGLAVFVRDPDGQLIELLPMAYWESLHPEG
jgi:catechol 2,3-dioxygenase-like lactoylglutathione lyase family enzyme